MVSWGESIEVATNSRESIVANNADTIYPETKEKKHENVRKEEKSRR
jgi:hypothetical protein